MYVSMYPASIEFTNDFYIKNIIGKKRVCQEDITEDFY